MGNKEQMTVIRWIYAGLLVVAAVPWLMSGAIKAAIFGGIAILVAVTVAVMPRFGFILLTSFAVVALGLLGLGALFHGPEMGPLQIDGMPLTGVRFALLGVALFGPVIGYSRRRNDGFCP